jgi:hypothetical protein
MFRFIKKLLSRLFKKNIIQITVRDDLTPLKEIKTQIRGTAISNISCEECNKKNYITKNILLFEEKGDKVGIFIIQRGHLYLINDYHLYADKLFIAEIKKSQEQIFINAMINNFDECIYKKAKEGEKND